MRSEYKTTSRDWALEIVAAAIRLEIPVMIAHGSDGAIHVHLSEHGFAEQEGTVVQTVTENATIRP